MKIAKYFFLAGAVAMGIAIVYGLTVGDFWGEGSVLMGLIWGKITMLDIYLSFFAFAGWMFFREGFNLKSFIIFIFILGLGSFTICLYTYIAMERSKGDWKQFWFGKKAHNV